MIIKCENEILLSFFITFTIKNFIIIVICTDKTLWTTIKPKKLPLFYLTYLEKNLLSTFIKFPKIYVHLGFFI